MKKLLAILLVLALTFGAGALAETAEPGAVGGGAQAVEMIGCEMVLPADWRGVASEGMVALATPASANPLADESSADGFFIFTNVGIPEAKSSLQWMVQSPPLVESAAGLIVRTGLRGANIDSVVDTMSGDSPILGYVVSGTASVGQQLVGTFYMPSVDDTVVTLVFKLPTDKGYDVGWFFDGLEAALPGFSGVRATVVQRMEDALKNPAPALPEADNLLFDEPLDDAAFEDVLSRIGEATLPELNRAFYTSPERTYWALCGDAVPLSPVLKHFEALGLTKPKASKGALSFTVDKALRAQWGDNKTIKQPVEGIDTKALTAPAAAIPALIDALEAQCSAPKALGEGFSKDPVAAYWALCGDAIPLAPVLKILDGLGLTKAKGKQEKDGATGVSFTIPKAQQERWLVAKTFSIGTQLTDAKALTAPLDGLRGLVGTAAQVYAPPSPFKLGRVGSGVSIDGGKEKLAGDVVIPAKNGLFYVTAIGDGAFKDQKEITSISIPPRVTKIGYGAFEGCDSLETIIFQDGAALVPSGSSFGSAPKLSRVVLPEGLLVIGDGAFYECKALRDVEIPQSVISIGSSAFSECGFASIAIPDSVRMIGDSAFSRYIDTGEYTQSSSAVMIVGEGSFAQQCAIDRQIPYALIEREGGTIRSVRCEAFDAALPVLEIPKSMGGDAITAIGERAFAGCVGMQVAIPEGVTTIGADAFADCAALSVSLPQSVADIAEDAFSGEAYTLSYPAGSYAERFVMEHGISQLLTDASGEWKYMLSETGAKIARDPARRHQGEVAIPDQLDGHPVTGIGAGAFKGGYEITGVRIPASVTEIGDSAFEDLYQLTSIEIPQGVTRIGALAFASCGSLGGVVIPDSVVEIGQQAFWNCYQIAEIEIPLSVKTIGSGAFAACGNLTRVQIPEGHTKIYDEMFRDCYRLGEVVIPSSVTAIGEQAFAGCYELTSVEIPEGVTEIGAQAFRDCHALTKLRIPDSVTSIGRWALSSCPLEVVETGEGSYARQYLQEAKDDPSRPGAWMEGMVAQLTIDPFEKAPSGAKAAILLELPENAPNGKPWPNVYIGAGDNQGQYAHEQSNCIYVDASTFSKISAVWNLSWNDQGQEQREKMNFVPESYNGTASFLGENGEQVDCFFQLHRDGTLSWGGEPAEKIRDQVRFRLIPLDGTPEDESFGRYN